MRDGYDGMHIAMPRANWTNMRNVLDGLATTALQLVLYPSLASVPKTSCVGLILQLLDIVEFVGHLYCH